VHDLDLGDVLSVRLAGGKAERRSGIACGPLSPKQGILSEPSLHALERMAVNGPESAGNAVARAANDLVTGVSTPGRGASFSAESEGHRNMDTGGDFIPPLPRPARVSQWNGKILYCNGQTIWPARTSYFWITGVRRLQYGRHRRCDRFVGWYA